MPVKSKLNREGVRLRIKTLHAANPVKGPSHEAYQALLTESAAPGEDLAWLASHDLDPEVSSGAFAALYHALRGHGVVAKIRERVRDRAAPVLLKALQSRLMPDSRKYSIGPLYSFCVGQVSGEEYRGFFNDFDAVTNRMIDEAVRNLGEDARSVDRVLTGMEALLEGEAERGSRFAAAFELAEHMLGNKPAAAAALCGAAVVAGWLEEDVRDSRVEAALNLLEQSGQPRALWALGEMARWPGIGPLATKAARTARKMEFKGVRAGCPLRARFSRGLVTGPDGLGSRQMALFYATPGGGMDALLFLYNELAGLKDILCVFDDGADVELELHERARELAMAPCGPDLARDFLADALARHEEAGTSPPANLIVYRPYLGAAPILPRRRTPDLSVYGLSRLSGSPGLVADSEQLAASPYYGMFMFTSDSAYAYFEEMGHIKSRPPRRQPLGQRSPGQRPASGYAALDRGVIDRFLREVAIEERDILLDRLAATLEVESWAGRARQQINQTAARTWLGITRNVLPFDQVPYVQAVGRLSAEMIIENVQMGFRSQHEVNEAALQTEQGAEA